MSSISNNEFNQHSVQGYKVWRSNLLDEYNIPHGFFGADLDILDEQNLEGATEVIFGERYRLERVKQVHGVELCNLSSEEVAKHHNCDVIADGLYKINSSSSDKSILGIQTADCAPVLISSKCGKLKIALHCGWRSSVGGILRSSIEIAKQSGYLVEDILLSIGPSAGACCYTVGAEFQDNLKTKYKIDFDFSPTFIENAQQTRFNLQHFLLLQAKSLGLISCNMSKIKLCTICDSNFFSYRRQKTESGRQLSFIGGPLLAKDIT